MDELNVDDILAGLGNAAYADHHIMLMQMLANLVCEEMDSATTKKVIEFCFHRLKSSMKNRNAEEIDLIFIIFSNITTEDAKCELFFELLESTPLLTDILKQALRNYLGIDSGVVSQICDPLPEEDPYQKMSSFLCNLTRTESGRKIILDRNPPCPFPYMLQQMKCPDNTRRKGAVGCVRNCMFNSDFHFWMVFELNILPSILTPLIVNTPFTEKERTGMHPDFVQLADNPDTKPEKDVEIVKMLMECVLLLCQKRWSRQHLRSQKAYCICRNLDYFLENDSVNDTMLEIVNFLERDEDLTEHEDAPPIPESFPVRSFTEGSENETKSVSSSNHNESVSEAAVVPSVEEPTTLSAVKVEEDQPVPITDNEHGSSLEDMD